VRIRTSAIGANFVDTKFRAGRGAIFQRPLPATLTGDVVGTVDRVGQGTEPGLAGRRVAVLSLDAFADHVIADATDLVFVPDSLDDVAASMLPSAAPVAFGTLLAGGLAPGSTVLVHAAAGNIGHLATQLAKLHGAGTVIGTAGSPAKLEFVRAHGADVAVDYGDDGWPDEVRAAAPGGVDVVLDAVGGKTTLHGVDLLAPFGRVVIYGAADDLVDVPARSLYELRSVSGFSMMAWQRARPAEFAAAGSAAPSTPDFHSRTRPRRTGCSTPAPSSAGSWWCPDRQARRSASFRTGSAAAVSVINVVTMPERSTASMAFAFGAV
jgi:NADPH2:quinone reductase